MISNRWMNVETMKTDMKIILPQDRSLDIDLSQENLDWDVVEIDEGRLVSRVVQELWRF